MDLNIQVNDDNFITNINELEENIRALEHNINSQEYLESLFNKLKYSEIKNKQMIMEAISAKLLEFKSVEEKINLSNQAALNEMQKYNEDMKKLSVISTSKDKNDSGKDIDYISIRHDNGEVEMLVCAGHNTLAEFIHNHADMVSKMRAEDIFRYYKENVHRELKFYDASEFDEIYPEMSNNAVVREEETKALELEEAEKYAKENGLEGKIEVTVDPSGERIYRIADAIIKFTTNYEDKRVMEVLRQPIERVNAHTNENYGRLLGELDEDKTEIFDISEIKARLEESQPITITGATFDKERLRELIVRKDVYEENLSAEELGYIKGSIKYLIDTMVERLQTFQGQANEEQAILDEFMEPLVNIAESIEEGRIDANELSEEDKTLVENYKNKQMTIESMGLKKKPIMKELKYDSESQQASGVAALVILLELISIGMLVLTFLSIDI
ncbi:MAG: hypothetical protein OSJ70_09040 [Bacilli bacterium]|nr:hypothetical protein [Bacilli bacterium]